VWVGGGGGGGGVGGGGVGGGGGGGGGCMGVCGCVCGQWRNEGCLGGFNPPPPKFRRPSKIVLKSTRF